MSRTDSDLSLDSGRARRWCSLHPVGFFIGFGVVVFVVVWLLVKAGTKNLQTSAGAISQLGQSGVRARGLVLQSSQLATGVTLNGQRFERRTMTIDVEIPGQAPYVISNGVFLLPRGLVEAAPGSSLELSVDAADRTRVVVLGPGGFTGPWIRTGPPNAY